MHSLHWKLLDPDRSQQRKPPISNSRRPRTVKSTRNCGWSFRYTNKSMNRKRRCSNNYFAITLKVVLSIWFGKSNCVVFEMFSLFNCILYVFKSIDVLNYFIHKSLLGRYSTSPYQDQDPCPSDVNANTLFHISVSVKRILLFRPYVKLAIYQCKSSLTFLHIGL